MEFKTKYHAAALLIGGLLAMTPGAGAQEVYRWVDENGEVHYSHTLPPEHKDKQHDLLNEEGIVVDEDLSNIPPPPEPEVPEEEQLKELPRDSSNLPRPKQLYSDAEMQRRMDNFLMLRYESEQEITDAMNVEIKQLNYDRRLIEGSQASTLEAYRGQIQEAGNRQRAGKTVDDDIKREIARLQVALEQSTTELAGLKKREESIREDFGKQLDRYRHLVEEAARREAAEKQAESS